MKRVSTAFHRRIAIVAASAAALVAGVAVLRAAHTPSSTLAAVPACTTTAAAETPKAGLRIAIDPETGQLGMPVDGTTADLVPAGKAGAAPTVEVLADGTQILHTNGQHRHYATVQLDATGKLQSDCSHDAPAALEVR